MSFTKWMKHSWRPAAAYVYLLICLSDFMFMPMIYAGMAKRNANVASVELALKFSGPTAQIEALKVIRDTDVWDPLTLKVNGLFHMAFGAILGVAAWTRGQEKVEARKNGQDPDSLGDTPQADSPKD